MTPMPFPELSSIGLPFTQQQSAADGPFAVMAVAK